MLKSLVVFFFVFAGAIASHGQSPSDSSASAQSGPNAGNDENAKPLDPSNRDTSVKPADDFFLYANGGWVKRTEIPPQYSRWGAFNQLIEKNNDALRDVAEKAEKTQIDVRLAPDTAKVGDYYASGMDEQTIEAMRVQPLKDEFQKIENIKDRHSVLDACAPAIGDWRSRNPAPVGWSRER